MDRDRFIAACLEEAPTPSYVVSEDAIAANLRILERAKERTGCRILLALKGFAMFSLFPLVRESLDGVCASSPHEARLGREDFGRQVHAFAPAYSEEDIQELLNNCDHIVFNSFRQWRKYRTIVEGKVQCALRINPECSTGRTALYDPCSPGSRLGIRHIDFEGESLDGITGLHFHTLCEQNADALALTLEAVESKFGYALDEMQWMNFGGGHHITRADYDVDLLCDLILKFKKAHDVEVYLEPSEAVALNAGVLIAEVMDIVHNEVDVAILNTSVTAHMPDVLEMPYRPDVVGADQPGKLAHTYRLGGVSCLAGDVIGDYSFEEPLKVGDRVVFEDMAHYTMVKNTTFNGVHLPAICVYSERDGFREIRTFGYEAYRDRLS